MNGFRHRLATAPLAVHALVFSAWFAIGTWALGLLVADERPEQWWGHVVAGLLWGALMTVLLARRRRQDGGAEQQWAVTTAVRDGRLPDDVDAERWRPLLERLLHQQVQARWLTPLVLGVLAVVCAGPAASGDVRMWAIAAAIAVLAVVGAVGPARRARRIEQLLQLLDGRIPADR